eukprot:Phypoly_transcript_15388.p1 GENE.Phypoly_transcript_15388~~Phypoly_transcript_15388.p1  ORF type:complete len:309 (+),score=60.36 Phypoly_transcript_15388:1-927(+)
MIALLHNYASFLPAYETRHAQQQIDAINNHIAQLRAAVAPRKKFSFSKKPTTTPASTPSPTPTPSSTPSSTPAPTLAPSTIPAPLTAPAPAHSPAPITTPPTTQLPTAFTSTLPDSIGVEPHAITSQSVSDQDQHSNQHATELLLPSQNCMITEPQQFVSLNFTMANLVNCKVYILQRFTAVRMKDLKGCTIVLGPVSGSIFIDNCTDCTFTIASQQQRIHNTHRCTIFTCCTSNPIIETCTQLQFGTYNILYNSREADFEAAGIDLGSPNSSVVQDFDWQKQGIASPNWSVLDSSLCTTYSYDKLTI